MSRRIGFGIGCAIVMVLGTSACRVPQHDLQAAQQEVKALSEQADEPIDSAGWAISVGGSMSGIGRMGDAEGPPPQMKAVLPDGRELTANEDGMFDVELPDHTRIFINGEFVFEIDDEAAERAALSNTDDVP